MDNEVAENAILIRQAVGMVYNRIFLNDLERIAPTALVLGTFGVMQQFK